MIISTFLAITPPSIYSHNQILYNRKTLPRKVERIVDNRDFLARVIWAEENPAADTRGYILVTSPTETPHRPLLKGVVRGKYRSAMRIKRKRKCNTHATIDFVIHPDVGGLVPTFIFARFMAGNLGRLVDI